ncbi:MAG: UvrD-helicase domain-containing protein [bacterium]
MRIKDMISNLLDLDKVQRRIAFDESPQIVSASAGSGKTRTLVARWLYLMTRPEMRLDRLAAITFTERAANELRERIRDAMRRILGEYGAGGGIQEEALTSLPSAMIGTIHSFCARVLREYEGTAGLPVEFEIVEGVESEFLLEQSVGRTLFGLLEKKDARLLEVLAATEYRLADLIEQIVETIEAARRRHVPLDECNPGSHVSVVKHPAEVEYTGRLLALAREAEREFQRAKRDQHVLDFDDLLEATHALLERRNDPAKSLGERYRHVLVDEFQDTDRRQYAILRKLAAHGSTLFCVGDAKQSIYRFRGSEVGIFGDAQSGLGLKAQTLRTNYRASPGLVQAFNRLFEPLFQELPHPEVAYDPMTSRRAADGAAPIRVLVNTGESINDLREHEMQPVVRLIASLRTSGVPYQEIGILSRTSNPVGRYERALRQAGIPYQTVSGRGFWDTAEVADMMGFLKCLLDPTDRIAWAGILKSPFADIPDDALYLHIKELPFPDGMKEEENRIQELQFQMTAIRSEMWRAAPDRLIGQILTETHYVEAIAGDPDAAERIGNLYKLIEVAARLNTHGRFGVTLQDFLDYLELFRDRGGQEGEALVEIETEDSVRLMTVHLAKGLEFHTVILVDTYYGRPSSGGVLVTGRGEVGHRMPKTARDDRPEQPVWNALREAERVFDREEEKRALYVGLTRAREQVNFVLNLPLKSARDGVRLPFNKASDDCFAALFCKALGAEDWVESSVEALKARLESAILHEGLELWQPKGKSVSVAVALPNSGTRLELVEPAARWARASPMTVVSVTDLSGSNSDALQSKGSGLGEAAHRMLALWDFGEARLEAALKKTAREFSLRKKDIDALGKMAHALLNSRLLKEIESAERVYKELELCQLDRRASRLIRGRADLVLRYPKGFCVYDFKWISGREGLVPYREELNLYTEVLAQSWGSAIGARFVLLPGVEIVEADEIGP